MMGLTLGINEQNLAAPWWPANASFAVDFINKRYMRYGAATNAAGAFSFSRPSVKNAEDLSDSWANFAADVPACTDRGLSLEPAETYFPTSADLSGMIVGTVGSGGSLASGWSYSTNGYGTLSVDTITSVNGLPAFTLTWDITNSGGSNIYPNVRFGDPTAAQGENWAAAMWYDATDNAGDSGVVSRLQLQERQGASYLTSAGNLTLAGNTARQSLLATLANANTDNLWCVISQTLTPGQSLKRTMTISMPTMTKSASLSSPLATSSVANTTRAADAMTLHLPFGTHDVTFTYEDDSNATVNGQSGDYAAGVHSKAVKSIIAVPA